MFFHNKVAVPDGTKICLTKEEVFKILNNSLEMKIKGVVGTLF